MIACSKCVQILYYKKSVLLDETNRNNTAYLSINIERYMLSDFGKTR